jgi:CheY-like chemotaxis protein
MDMRMPVTNGYEATQKIRSTLKGQATIIVALTASAFEKDRKIVLGAGCDDFIRKPFQEQELLNKIAAHLGVKYLYEDKTTSRESNLVNCQEVLNSPEISQQIATMSEEWIKQLCYAAAQCSDLLILELIKQIPTESKSLSRALTELVDNFRFDRILELARNPEQ